MSDSMETSTVNSDQIFEQISPMSDYSTSTAQNEARYQEPAQIFTPDEIMSPEETTNDDGAVDIMPEDPDLDDEALIENNPVAALAETFQGDATERTLEPYAIKPYTREEALRATEDLKVKLLHALEAQYDLVRAAQEAFDRHIWQYLGYEKGMKGWVKYCADNFSEEKIRVTGQQRTDLIMGFDPNKISNRGIAALLGISDMTVGRAKAKAGIAPAEGRVRDATGKRQHVDTSSMSSKERQQEIVRLREEGMKQTDIAEQLDVSQSTVSDALRRDKEQRMSEGLAEVAPMAPTEVEDVPDDQLINLDEGNAEKDEREWVDAVCSYVERADGYLGDLIEEMQGERWKPGDGAVDEIVVRESDRLMDVVDKVGKLVRILDRDSADIWPGEDNGHFDRFYDETVEGLSRVVEEALS